MAKYDRLRYFIIVHFLRFLAAYPVMVGVESVGVGRQYLEVDQGCNLRAI